MAAALFLGQRCEPYEDTDVIDPTVSCHPFYHSPGIVENEDC